MSVELIKYAFVAGEISPTLFGRTDLEKYELGLAQCQNFFVDYKGGISTRPGTQFLDYIWRDFHEVKMFPFQFDTDVTDTYMIIFGNFYVRFMQQGVYVEELNKSIVNLTQANPGRITITAHGFVTGDWVRMYQMTGMTSLNRRIAEVLRVDNDTFAILDEYGNPIDTSGLGPFVAGDAFVRRIYTLPSPYASTDLEILHARQIRDLVRLTHPKFKTRNLIRFAADDWVFMTEHLRPKGQLNLRKFGDNLPTEEMTVEEWLKFLKLLGYW